MPNDPLATSTNQYGICACGCGQPTALAKTTWAKYGMVKGKPNKYIHHHNARGEHNSQWRGGTTTFGYAGYKAVKATSQSRSPKRGYIKEHILVAERALGKPLPLSAKVHHVNDDNTDNRNNNLVICQDQAYHMLLHVRAAAKRACGNPDYRLCKLCHKHGDPTTMYRHRNKNGRNDTFEHRECVKVSNHNAYLKRKAAQANA